MAITTGLSSWIGLVLLTILLTSPSKITVVLSGAIHSNVQFNIATGNDSVQCCPVEQADTILQPIESRLECSLQCLQSGCLSFTYFDSRYRCEIYSNLPSYFQLIAGCFNYRVNCSFIEIS